MSITRKFQEIQLSRRSPRATEQANSFHKSKKEVPQPALKLVDNSLKKARKVELKPKSLNQEAYIELLTDPSKVIVFATGPAGTGKTLLAVMAAIKAYQEGTCKKIIISRPAVTIDDEQHGFLPGDLTAKMEPWAIPIMDVFAEYYKQTEIEGMLEDKIIELAPIGYLRGRSLKDAWIILDEAQNASKVQMKAILTRIGQNSKMVVTGDLGQIDTKYSHENGMTDFTDRLAKTNSKIIATIQFSRKDIQRSAAVAEVLSIYGED